MHTLNLELKGTVPQAIEKLAVLFQIFKSNNSDFEFGFFFKLFF
jgi:hypothetical protein